MTTLSKNIRIRTLTVTFIIIIVIILVILNANNIVSTPTDQIDKKVDDSITLNLFERLIEGDLNRVKLTYSSTDPQMLEINDLVYVIREPSVMLVADFTKDKDNIVLNLTLTIKGVAQVFDNGKLVKTISDFDYKRSMILNWYKDTYYFEGGRIGALPFLVYPSEKVYISSVYIVDKGNQDNITSENLVDLYLTNPMETVIDLSARTAFIPELNKSLTFESIPTLYYEIANISGRTKLYLLQYTDSSMKLPFHINGVIIERDTGVVLSFDLIGAPKVRNDTILRYDATEFEYYPVSPLGLYFNILTPETFFELEHIEVE